MASVFQYNQWKSEWLDRSCTESLYQETISCENETDCEVNKDIVAILQNIEFIWHLTEILHVEAVSGMNLIRIYCNYT